MPSPLMSIEEILSVLRETPDRLRHLTCDLSEDQLHAPPEPGEWSVTEILAHLRSCADVWGDAIVTMISTDHPTIRAVSPATWIDSTDYRALEFSPSLQAFTKQRDGQLSLLGQLPTRAWARNATVVGAGKPLDRSVQFYAARLARHERAHWRQVAKTVRAVVD